MIDDEQFASPSDPSIIVLSAKPVWTTLRICSDFVERPLFNSRGSEAAHRLYAQGYRSLSAALCDAFACIELDGQGRNRFLFFSSTQIRRSCCCVRRGGSFLIVHVRKRSRFQHLTKRDTRSLESTST